MDKKEQNPEVLAFLEALNTSSADNLTSWEGLYTRLKEVSSAYTNYQCVQTASYAIATLLSFVLALEELPEEGDVVVIARRLNEILVTRPDLTGVTLHVGSVSTKEGLEQVISAIKAEALAAYDEATATEEAGPTRILH